MQPAQGQTPPPMQRRAMMPQSRQRNQSKQMQRPHRGLLSHQTRVQLPQIPMQLLGRRHSNTSNNSRLSMPRQHSRARLREKRGHCRLRLHCRLHLRCSQACFPHIFTRGLVLPTMQKLSLAPSFQYWVSAHHLLRRCTKLFKRGVGTKRHAYVVLGVSLGHQQAHATGLAPTRCHLVKQGNCPVTCATSLCCQSRLHLSAVPALQCPPHPTSLQVHTLPSATHTLAPVLPPALPYSSRRVHQSSTCHTETLPPLWTCLPPPRRRPLLLLR